MSLLSIVFRFKPYTLHPALLPILCAVHLFLSSNQYPISNIDQAKRLWVLRAAG